MPLPLDLTVSDSVLLVEDDVDVRKLIKQQIAKNFSVVYEAENGKEALQLLAEKEPAIALIDIGLPEGMSGLDVLEHIARKHAERTLAIILTAHSDKEIIRKALRLGAFDFIDKPCDADILQKSLERAREMSMYRRELGAILEFLVCEYGRFSPEEFAELSLEQKAQMLTMVKGILSLKAARKKMQTT